MTYLLINDYLTKFPTSNIEKAREFLRNVYFCFIDCAITLKLNIQKIKIMASSPIISWQIDGETKGTKDVKVLVPQSCLTLCDLMNCSPPGSSIHGILQARILAWVAIRFSRGSSWPRDQTQVSCIACRFFTIEPPGKPDVGSYRYIVN